MQRKKPTEINNIRRIDTILEERRANARRALDVRRERVYEMLPELEQIDYDIAAAGLKHNRDLLSGEVSLDGAQSGLQAEIDVLKKRRETLLESREIAGDTLELTPYCAVCGDTGVVADAGGQPARCGCYMQLLFNSLESSSNIVSAGVAGFELFDENLFSGKADETVYKQAGSPRDNILTIKDSAWRFIRSFNEGAYENLYFFGKPGTGKTFMAASIAHELMRGGTAVLYLSAPALFNIITEHRLRSVRDEDYRDALYRQIFACKLLIIDDLGIESLTDARYTEFITILNERIVPGACSTIIVTNMDLKKLQAQYDERVFSRVVGSFRIIRFFGEDIRLKRPGGG